MSAIAAAIVAAGDAVAGEIAANAAGTGATAVADRVTGGDSQIALTS